MTDGVPDVQGGTAAAPAHDTCLDDVMRDIAAAIEEASHGVVTTALLTLGVPPSQTMGDFAFATFAAAKEMKQSPAAFTAELASQLRPTTYIDRWHADGPYLNVFLKRDAVAKRVLADVLAAGEHYGYGTTFAGETVVLEYVQPNTNKPLHLGHLRNALLALTVSRLLETQGATVKKVNIVNDRGIHIVKSMLAYQRWGKNETPETTKEKGDHFVGRYYVLFEHALTQERTAWMTVHPGQPEEDFLAASTLMADARTMLKQWEAGDEDVRELWQHMNDWVLKGFAETYRAVGISFDKEYFESTIYTGGKELILEGLRRGVFTQLKDGAILAPLSKTSNLPDKVLLRADGTSLYITQDIHLAKLKNDDFHPTRSIYVVGSEQDLYFKQLFAILKLLGLPAADNTVHLSYGLVFLPEGKMKSREGKVVDADDLLAQVQELAATELTRRYPDLSEPERAERARAIAFAAIAFHFLLVGRTSPVQFDPKESLSFEGRTGPYLQYSIARASSILRKAKGEPGVPAHVSAVADPEWALLLSLLCFPTLLKDAAAAYDPAVLANGLVDFAQAFSTFYHELPVLEAEPEVRDMRLALVRAVRTVLSNGLLLLGIRAIEEM